MADPRHRRYAHQVAKALATFGQVTEWADFSAFLSRLHKALQPPPGLGGAIDIPHKHVVAKRLAQGLNPALPNGVHQRAVDVYREILHTIGPQGLASDLQVWAAGLLPFFQYAATAVRPAVLELYEVYFLPLQHRLKPVAKALALALLPGIEEETGDFYERVTRLLDAIEDAVGPAFFAQCLFLVVSTNPGVRVAAVSGLMIRALSTALADPNVLVLRGVLDFLNTAVPVAVLVQGGVPSQGSASSRLYTWLLGGEDAAAAVVASESSSSEIGERFRKEVMPLVVRSLTADIQAPHDDPPSPDSSDPYQAYKVFVALLDKWEIGYPLSRGFAYFALGSLRKQGHDAAHGAGDVESIRISAQAIYNAVEPYVVWSAVYAALQGQEQQGSNTGDDEVNEWLLQNFSKGDKEVSTIHAPLLLGHLMRWMNDGERLRNLPPSDVETLAHVTEMLLQTVSTEDDDTQIASAGGVESVDEFLQRICSLAGAYYEAEATMKPPNEPTIPVSELAIVLFQGLTATTAGGLETMKQVIPQLQILRLLRALVKRLRGMERTQPIAWARTDFLHWIEETLKASLGDLSSPHTSRTRILTVPSLTSALGRRTRDFGPGYGYCNRVGGISRSPTSAQPGQNGYTEENTSRGKIRWVSNSAFRLLPKTRTAQQQQLVSLILRMHTDVNPALIENVIMECLCDEGVCMRSSVYAFGALWDASLESRHLPLDKPMFYLLDNVESQKPEVQRSIQAWLKQEPLGFLKMIDRILCSMLSKSPPVDPGTVHNAGRDYEYLLFQKPADIRILTYHVAKLHEVIRIGAKPLRLAMEERVVNEPTLSAYSKTDVISNEILQLTETIFQPSRIPEISVASEDNLILLLRTVNSLVHYTLGDGFKAGQNNPSKTPVLPSESVGLLGYVFSSSTPESEITTIENGLPKTAGLESMRSVIALLMDVYIRSGKSLESRIEDETRTAMRNFYRLHPEEFLESVIDIALGEKPFKVNRTETDASAIVDDVAESAHRVVDLITLALSKRLSAGEEQRKRNLHLTTDAKMLAFLRDYISRLEAPIAVQTSSFCLGLTKALVQSSNVGQRKRLAPGIFQVLNVVLVKVASTSALTDRRYRKDVQDTFLRMLETTATSLNEASTTLNQGEILQKDVRNRVIETRQFITNVTLSNLRDILIEEDRVLQAATVILNTFVLPTLRSRSRSELIAEQQALDILLGLSCITYTLKLWKGIVLDIFNDPGFFSMKPELRPLWRTIIASLMDQDRERFPELLGNFFANKEQEAITKAANIRRLSLLLLAAETNHYLIQLPHIQERLVEILRTPSVYPAINAEVYLCLRIMLCRFSSQQLTNFWPMILSELIFESAMEDLPKDGSDQLTTVLAACKFLDLLIALQIEDFQIHQWMFLTDTADAIYSESRANSESILDRLAGLILGTKPDTERNLETPSLVDMEHVYMGRRRPVLATISKIQSIQDLAPFFVKASTLAYEGVYEGSSVDWEYIEQTLDDEIFCAT
ncbi:hypothetical protein QFC19_009100 [Naganishia cerealis]|uniref:Uncharacterized protein n=1 Tax=Naganishia cerealis TaxID=610337 RepID=A0ACC2UYM5_9TREE|nr:hypothetical protein QFC19_009100 [Naganishia cerealis]